MGILVETFSIKEDWNSDVFALRNGSVAIVKMVGKELIEC
jgi:hypothetical protein